MLIALPVTTVIAQAASASPSPAAAASSDAAVTARAKDWLRQLQTGKIDRSQLDDKMNAALTDSVLANVSAQIAPLGNPSAFTLTRKAAQGGVSIYVFKVQFASVTLNEILALDSDGKIAGLRLMPQNP